MPYPPIVFEHLETLTDSTGIIQHAIFSIPNRISGYTTDDNARAMVAAVMQYERTQSRPLLRLISTYLSFMHYAQTPSGHFHNFMSYDQEWLDDTGSDDCLGRSLWGCGYLAQADLHPNVKKVAKQLFDNAVKWLPDNHSLRAMGYAVTGCSHYLNGYPDADNVRQIMKQVCCELCQRFESNVGEGWGWFEDIVSYNNAFTPRALMLAYQQTGEKDFLRVGEESLEFLTRTCIIDDTMQPIGCHGWYVRGGGRAFFDQQPVDPMGHVLAYLTAYDVTAKAEYIRLAQISYEWFFGRNVLGVPLHDPFTGGCCDALTEVAPNLNQGAESTISCLLAQLSAEPYHNLMVYELT